MSETVHGIIVGAVATLAVAGVAMSLTAVVAWRLNRVSVVDVTWGLALAAVAAVGAVRDGWAAWALFGLVALWGIRLSSHIARRSRGHGEDPRYVDVLGGELHDVGFGRAVRKVFLVQGLAVCLVALPLNTLPVFDLGSPAAFAAGAVVAVAGICFEAIGDAQLAAYKASADRGPVMDRGLWAWTRHPNYFGDALFWIGIWIAGGVAAGNSAWPAILTVASPVAMTLFLWLVTGARPLEKTMMKRPGYPKYAARTSMFIPLPPRR